MIQSIKYGLSTKVNYTKIEVEFNPSKQNKYAYEFVAMFDNPVFYMVDSLIYVSDLDLNDFWETGGGIVLDNKSIGIFLTNDLYDMF